MAISGLLPNGQQQFLDQNGDPLAGGWVYMYEPGTTTPATTWQDRDLTVPNTNPILLDSAGECRIWGDGAAYRQVVTDSTGALVWDQETVVNVGNVRGPTSGTSTDGNFVFWLGATGDQIQDLGMGPGNVDFTGGTISGLSSLGVDGNTAIGGDLGVVGDTALGGVLAVDGLATFDAGLTVTVGDLEVTTGAGTIGGNLTVEGASLILPTGDLEVTLGDGTFGGDLDVGGNLTVGGTSNLTGLLTVTGGIITGNGMTIASDLDVGGDLSVGDQLDVAGATTLDDLTVGGDLVVNGTATFSGGGSFPGADTYSFPLNVLHVIDLPIPSTFGPIALVDDLDQAAPWGELASTGTPSEQVPGLVWFDGTNWRVWMKTVPP